MSRRAATLLVAAAGVLIALAVAVVSPVPYVALTPGPTLNTLGVSGSKPLIQIRGHPTYPTSGHLNLVTVSFLGGPGTNFNIFAALRAWLSPDDAVVPEQEIFTPGQTPQQVARQDTEQMANSQQTAQAAALCQLNIGFKTVDTIEATVKGMPAAGRLQPGDVITAVDGRPVTCRADAGTLIKARRPGAPVELTVLRHGRASRVRLATADVQGQPEIGVQLGRFIAGTGEIEANGTVDPIGGIQQKMVGAREAGATIFLTPAANCPDTAGAVPAGMRLIKVSSLAGAVDDLEALKAGQPVPSC